MASGFTADAASDQIVRAACAPGIDVAMERIQTPGAAHSSHFNAAGAALPPASVVARVVEHLRLEELMGGYEAASRVKDDVEDVYRHAATLIGAESDEVALFDSASSALRTALDALRPAPGTRIIASRSTYVSHALHLMTMDRAREVELVIAPADDNRRIDLTALESMLSDGRPSIVSIAHVPTSSGLIEPAAAVGSLAKAYGATYVLDATQSVGQLAIDVKEVGCDVLATTGRKFLRAPRGTALAYFDRQFAEALLPAAPDVRGSRWHSERDWDLVAGARRFETWEAGIAARLGLGVALREAIERGMPETADWLQLTAHGIREALRSMPGVLVTDPPGAVAAIVTFVVEGIDPAETVRRLAAEAVSVVSVPASHGQWDLGDRDIPSVVRVSPHVYNDDQDVEQLLHRVADVATGPKVRTA